MVQILSAMDRFLWNISKNVGPGQPNALDDVELVRFGYFKFKFVPGSQIVGEMRAQLEGLRSSGPFGPDLAAVIVAHQRAKGGTQDGIVSVMRGTPNVSYDGHNQWALAALNAAMVFTLKETFPRIDTDVDSGPAVTAAVRRIMVGP